MPGPEGGGKRPPVAYINLRPLAWVGVGALLAGSPYLRGLFFAPDALTVQVFLGVVFLLWLADRLLRREGPVTLDLLDWAVLAFAGAYFLSLAAAVSVPNAASACLKALGYALLYLVVSRLATGLGGAVRVLAVHFWAAVGVAVVGLAAATGYFYYPGAFDSQRIMSTLQYPNALAVYLAVASLLGLTLQSRRWRPVPLVLYGAGQFLLMVALLGSQSRGGWVLYPLAVVGYCLLLPRVRVYRVLFGFLVPLGAAVFATRSFLPAAMAGQGATALTALALGLAAVVGLNLGVYYGERLLRRHASERVRRAVAAGAVIYAALVGLLYLALAGQAGPSVAGALLPSPLVARAQAISGYEPSFQMRMIYDRDALRIMSDHLLVGAGGGAWNALYHRYADSQYFTTEVHNHFLQVAVEAGVLGLAAFGLCWYAFVRLLWRLRRRLDPEEDEEEWALVWAAGVAGLALGVHSFFDFDLSLPALAYVLWSLWAVVRGQEGAAGSGRVRKFRPATAWRAFWKRAVCHPVGQPVVAGALALLLLWPSWSWYRAGRIGAEAARALEAKELLRARDLYQQARRLDPYTASYAADLAQVLTALGLAENREADQALARELAREAARLEPYNPQVRAALSLVYLLQGYVEEAVAEAEAVVQANPWDVGAWEQLGRAYVGGARYYMRFGYAEPAERLLRKALDLPARVAAQAARRDPRQVWQGPALKVTPGLQLVRGQAAYLLGRPGEAASALEVAYRDKNLAREVAPWLAAALAGNGREDEAQRILQLYPGAGEEYRALIAGRRGGT
ncbi:MAG: O-antigen ligase family protein [Moorellales bacterium]